MSGIIAALLMLAAAPGAVAVVPPAPEVERPDVTKMKMSQIREHNAGIAKEHRYYIVCRTDTVTGSLAKRARTCRTREDWDIMARNAQQFLNDTVDRGLQTPVPRPEGQ
jgi:hypothetical protein